MRKLLGLVILLGATLGCGHPSSGPLIGGTATPTTTGTTIDVGQLVTWGDTTSIANPTGAPITLKSVRLLPSGDASGAVEQEATILPAGDGPDFTVPGLEVGVKTTWYGRSVKPVDGYVLQPTPPQRDGDSILFVVRAVRQGKWTYRGFEVAYTAGDSSYVADYTKNHLVICVNVSCH